STTIARDVLLKLDLPDGVQLGDVLGYHAQLQDRSVIIPMSDFSAGQVERVVVRLRVDARQPGKTVDVTGLKLQYNDLLKGGAARAQSAANTNQAAELLRKGDKGGAKQLLQANEMIFEGTAKVAGAPAVAADMAAQQATIRDFDQANDGAEVEHQVKEAKKKA